MEQHNPFITTGYLGEEYFCNRVEESGTILSGLTNGRSITITSLRRLGKTGLIKHVLSKLPEDYEGIYLDILPTENMNDFLNTFISAVMIAIPEKSSAGEKLFEIIKSLRPYITFDPLTGLPQVTIDSRTVESPKQIGAILNHLETYPKKIIIAIDEFQQILNYPEANTDAWLRSIIQNLNNVRFIFSGSQQHLMAQIFSDPSRPFYNSTGFLKIGKIADAEYSAFIRNHFKKGRIEAGMEVINEILEWTQTHTYYVQLLCNRIYSTQCGNIVTETWKTEADRLIRENEPVFFRYRDLLTSQQWSLLKAIAHAEKAYSPTSKDFIARYSLGSPATVLRSLQALQLRDLIYSDYDKEGNGYFGVYDLLFKKWIQRINLFL